MKIALLGYGKMGKVIEKIALERGHEIVLKKDQHSGELTEGEVKQILTKSSYHPHGIKVKLTDGQVGRVKEVLEDN